MSTRSIDQILISLRHRNWVDSFVHLKSTSKLGRIIVPENSFIEIRQQSLVNFWSKWKMDVEIWSKFFQLDVKDEAIKSIPFQAIQDRQFQTMTSFNLYAFCYQYHLRVAVQHYWSDALSYNSTSKWSRFLVDRKHEELFRETSRPFSWISITGITNLSVSLGPEIDVQISFLKMRHQSINFRLKI